jgi:hypothetical protein
MGVGHGTLPGNKKYVVLLEFYGGAHFSKTLQLKKSLDALVKKYKGKIRENESADKRKADPKKGWDKKFKDPTPQEKAEELAQAAEKAKKLATRKKGGR